MKASTVLPEQDSLIEPQPEYCEDCALFIPYAWGIFVEGNYRVFTRIEARYCPVCGREIPGVRLE